MLHVVDSSGWIEYFTGGENAEKFSQVLEKEEDLITPSVVLMEVYKWILRNYGEDKALTALTTMKQGRVIDLDSFLAVSAAENSHRLKLSLADSIIYTVAQSYKAKLYTQDADMEGLEGVVYIRHSGRGRE